MKADRLVSMILILLDKKRVGARELADLFEVSPRTIYRDIESINLAGIPIRSTPGAGGGFEIMENYKVGSKVFSAADLSVLLLGLSSLSHMVPGEDLVNAMAKVRSFIPPDRAKDIELKAEQISIDLSPWMGNRNLQPYLETIKAALQESRLLSFTYIAHHGAKTFRTVEPCQLVLKGSHWYLQGYCRLREEFRLFRLSRISDLQMSGETFTRRAHQRPELDLAERLEAMQTRITLRVHRSVLDRVLDFCALEAVSPDGAEHYIVPFPFIENDYHYDILLGFGPQCECLGPPHVRAEMGRRTREIAGLYEEMDRTTRRS